METTKNQQGRFKNEKPPEYDRLDSAKEVMDAIGGTHGNGPDELAPIAIAEALVAIGDEIRALRAALEASGGTCETCGGSRQTMTAFLGSDSTREVIPCPDCTGTDREGQGNE